MIQRIQSIYLVLAFICMALLLFFPIFSIEFSAAGTDTILETAYLNKDGVVTSNEIIANLPLSYFYIGLALLSAICILLYKKRKRQLLITRLNLIVHVLFVLAIYAVYYFGESFIVQEFNQRDYEDVEVIFSMQLGFFFLIPPIAFIYLAIRGIKRDENLINSLDRLR